MDLTVNPKVDLSETTRLDLGGVAFRVAPLALRQSARVAALLPDVLAILNRRLVAFSEHPEAAAAAVASQTGAQTPPVSAEDAGAFLRAISLSERESLLLASVAHIGLTRVYPQLTLDDILDLPIASGDLVNAANAIISASSLAGRKDANAGEAGATSR